MEMIDNSTDLRNLFNSTSLTSLVPKLKKTNFFENDDIIMVSENDNICSDPMFAFHTCHIFTKDWKYLSSFGRVLQDNELVKKYLQEKCDFWDDFTVSQCFEGPVVQVFFHNNWHIATEKSLNASETYGTSSKSVRDYFIDTGKCDFNKLDKDCCYYFVILHNKLKHIVQYSHLGQEYKELVLIDVRRVGPERAADVDKMKEYPEFIKPIIYHFSCFDELEATMDKITYDNAVYKRISTPGFIIRHGDISLKLQTEIYRQIYRLKPLEQNNYQVFLELYQHDKLNEVLPYVSKYSNDIIHRINMSMKTLSREILNIYHTTRKRKNSDIYDTLPDSYKKLLYGIHGLYIKGRKKDFVNGREVEGRDTKSITIHDIYYHLKNLSPAQLRQIYLDRNELMKNHTIIPQLNLTCIYTLTQSRLLT
jgi:hypothetical protein